MPLNMEGLKSVEVNSSLNPFLQPVWRAVDIYNKTGGRGQVAGLSDRFREYNRGGRLPAQSSELTDGAEALQQIMRLAAGYLTCKPPGRSGTKRFRRWDAMTELMADVTLEARRLGIKLVEGPNDFREVSGDTPSVWLEVADPEHRSFAGVSEHYSRWLSDPEAIKNKTSFWEWKGERRNLQLVEYDQSARYFVEGGKAGRLTDIDGHKVATDDADTHWGGSGWGIYAIDTEMRMHIGRHSDGDDYDPNIKSVRHVSLTGGKPVVAAGEICIVDGKIRAISNMTGHYQVGQEQFLNYVSRTTSIPGDAVVKFFGRVIGENGETMLKHMSAITVEALRSRGPAGQLLDRDAAMRLVPEAAWDDLDRSPIPNLGYSGESLKQAFIEEREAALESASSAAAGSDDGA